MSELIHGIHLSVKQDPRTRRITCWPLVFRKYDKGRYRTSGPRYFWPDILVYVTRYALLPSCHNQLLETKSLSYELVQISPGTPNGRAMCTFAKLKRRQHASRYSQNTDAQKVWNIGVKESAQLPRLSCGMVQSSLTGGVPYVWNVETVGSPHA